MTKKLYINRLHPIRLSPEYTDRIVRDVGTKRLVFLRLDIGGEKPSPRSPPLQYSSRLAFLAT